MSSLGKGIAAVFASAFCSCVVAAQSAPATIPTTQSAGVNGLTFRQKTGIARLPLMRAAVSEAGLSDDKRDKLLGILDDSDQKLRDLIAEYDNSDGESSADLEEKRQNIVTDFQNQTGHICTGPDQMMISRAMESLQVEFHLIEKATLADAMSKLDLTDDQQTKIKSIIDQTADKLKKPSTTNPSTAIPEPERRQAVLLDAHQQVRDLLTDDQKDQWETELHHRAESHGGVSQGAILRAIPRPAP